jgi:hypothetical protein
MSILVLAFLLVGSGIYAIAWVIRCGWQALRSLSADTPGRKSP